MFQGLKFLTFPYLLTLQLKRFDFDYNTLHRIKLNDRSLIDSSMIRLGLSGLGVGVLWTCVLYCCVTCSEDWVDGFGIAFFCPCSREAGLLLVTKKLMLAFCWALCEGDL